MSATAMPGFNPSGLGDLMPASEDFAIIGLESFDELLDIGLLELGIDRGIDLLLGLRPGPSEPSPVPSGAVPRSPPAASTTVEHGCRNRRAGRSRLRCLDISIILAILRDHDRSDRAGRLSLRSKPRPVRPTKDADAGDRSLSRVRFATRPAVDLARPVAVGDAGQEAGDRRPGSERAGRLSHDEDDPDRIQDRFDQGDQAGLGRPDLAQASGEEDVGQGHLDRRQTRAAPPPARVSARRSSRRSTTIQSPRAMRPEQVVDGAQPDRDRGRASPRIPVATAAKPRPLASPSAMPLHSSGLPS